MLIAGLAALTLLAVAALTRPWWDPRLPGGPAQRAANVAAYRTRIAEIERDAAAGVIAEGDAEVLRREAAAQLLGDTGDAADDTSPHGGSAPSRWIAALLAVAVPLFAGLWYWNAGSWRVQQQLASAPAQATIPPDVQAMVERLAARLQSNPDDAQGWTMLGRSYFVMHRFAESAGAYHQANAHNGGKEADTLAAEGEALAFADGREVPPDAAALFDRALVIDPNDGRALWYGGLADAQGGNFSRARQRWTRLRGMELPEQMKALLDKQLAQLDTAAGAAGEPPMAAQATAAGAATTTTAGTSAAASPVSLHLTVRVAPALAAKIPAGAMVFVYAKAENGPPMPLAVFRQPVAEWPLKVTLDDSMAMAPGMGLSRFDRYAVSARISASGQAMPQSGDLEGVIHLGRGEAASPHEIVIDRQIP
jgi:cytochrome c-type biogenesis protein CcmH